MENGAPGMRQTCRDREIREHRSSRVHVEIGERRLNGRGRVVLRTCKLIVLSGPDGVETYIPHTAPHQHVFALARTPTRLFYAREIQGREARGASVPERHRRCFVQTPPPLHLNRLRQTLVEPLHDDVAGSRRHRHAQDSAGHRVRFRCDDDCSAPKYFLDDEQILRRCVGGKG